MEEPQQSNPADTQGGGPVGDGPPSVPQTLDTQTDNDAHGTAQDMEHGEVSAAEAKEGVEEGTKTQEPARDDQTAGKTMVNGDGNDTVTKLPNGEDKMALASQGLAQLDLDPAAIVQSARAALNGLGEEPFPAIDPSASLFMEPAPLEDGPPKIQAFAKVEFEDGQYYINTYAVELGRDVRAAKRAQQRQFQREVVKRDRRRRGSDSSDEPKPFGYRRYAPSSVVSESGGIVNFDSIERRPRRKSKSTRATSPSSSSFSRSRNNSVAEVPEVIDYQSLAYERLLSAATGGANDAASYVPSLDDVPLIPVHPPTNEDQPGAGYGGISRRHARIAYNFDANCFEFETIGRNGGFVDEIWLAKGERAALDHGSKIQIGGVTMIFLLPNRGFTGTENTLASEALSAMSFEFEDGRGESLPVVDSSMSVSSEELPVDEGSGSEDSDEDEDGPSGEDSDRSDTMGDATGRDNENSGGKGASSHRRHKTKGTKRHHSGTKAPKIKLNLKKNHDTVEEEKAKSKNKPTAPAEREKPKPEQATLEDIANKLGLSVGDLPTRRKGPGRPPKDGVMSKREFAQLIRIQKEKQKAEGLQNGTLKVGKGVPPASGPIPEKRKYTKRKKPDEDGGDDPNSVRESIEGNDETTPASRPVAKPVKEKQSTKPPRSPSPVFDEASLTPEQLAKPTQSYVVLIYEALSNSPARQMSLPQIYRAIERRYPYYKLRVTTQGWQSSVRHNLSQHGAFRKIEKDGKGWMWGLVPNVSIEKEKKRRPSPPPAPQPNFYSASAGQQFRPNQYSYTGPPGAATSQTPPQVPYPYAAAAPGYSAPIPDVPRGYTGPLLPGQGVAAPTYQSPYTPAPSAPVPPPPAPPYAGNLPTTHNPALSNPYYNSAAHSRATPSSAPATQHATFTAPPPKPSTTSKAFSTTRTGVPQPILDACSNFKTKLMEQLTTTPTIGDTIDKALNRVLSSIIDGDNSAVDVQDPIEKIFVDEARPVIEGIWRSSGQTKAPAQPAPPAEDSSAAAASLEEVPAPADGTSVTEETHASDASPDKQNDGAAVPETTKGSAAPLEQHQQTPIQNLLQQLGQAASKSVQDKQQKDVAPDASTAANETSAPTQRAQVMTASLEAAEKAITALNVSTKRGYEDDDGTDEKEAGNEDVKKEERPNKRIAV